jgi:hypothetical protein
VVAVTDVLIRNVDDNDLARIDARAKRLGLPRSEYLRRLVTQEATREAALEQRAVTPADFEKFSNLADEEWMRGAWE